MRKTIAAFAAAGAVIIGAGAAGATAAADATPPTTITTGHAMNGMDMGSMSGIGMQSMPHDPAAMDAMHTAMRDQMPPEMAGQCDAMHTTMHGQAERPAT